MSVSQSPWPRGNARPRPRRNEHEKYSYGTPPPHSLTEQRGKAAHDCIGHEVLELCQVLAHHNENGTATFGHLFHLYETKNNKLVGLLLRAKRHGLVVFTHQDNNNKEMLFQGQDDAVEIQLVQSVYQSIVKSIQDHQHDDNQEPPNTETIADPFEWGNSLSNLSRYHHGEKG